MNTPISSPPVLITISDPMKQFWKSIPIKATILRRITSDMTKGAVFI